MKKITLLFFSVFFICNAFAQKKLIHCGTLIDGVSNAARSQVTIVVEKNKITAVQNGYTTPQTGDEVIDLKSKTVMPGLIDLHVHIESETSRDPVAPKCSMKNFAF